MIDWHAPSQFARYLAIVVFVGAIPTLSFYIGMQYQDMLATAHTQLMYDVPRLQHYQSATAAESMIETATSTEQPGL